VADFDGKQGDRISQEYKVSHPSSKDAKNSRVSTLGTDRQNHSTVDLLPESTLEQK